MTFYVLDTNVLLYDPGAVARFGDGTVVVAECVRAELRTFADDRSELGQAARDALAALPPLAAEAAELPVPPEPVVVDDELLRLAAQLQDRHPARRTTLVTMDQRLQASADRLGLRYLDYETERSAIAESYTGVRELDVADDAVDLLFADGVLPIELLEVGALPANQYVVLRGGGASRRAIARVEGANLVPLRKLRSGVLGIKPRSKEQHFVLDAILAHDIRLVTVTGVSGSGKTMLSLAAALHLVAEEQQYRTLIVTSPMARAGSMARRRRDMEPWARQLLDSIDDLVQLSPAKQTWRQTASRSAGPSEDLVGLGFLELVPLTQLQGHTTHDALVFIDDAQNLTQHEAMSVISCMGDRAKIVLAGDCRKVASPYVDTHDNGLIVVIERFRTEAVAAHVALKRNERSALAELASRLL